MRRQKGVTLNTLSIDRLLKKKRFYIKSCRKYPTKTSTKHLFNSLNNPKQPLHAKNYFENNIF